MTDEHIASPPGPSQIASALEALDGPLASGYQAHVYKIEVHGQPYIIKQAVAGPLGFVHRYMLRREARAYAHAQGIAGVPTCHGLVNGQYLVLEFIDGHTLREQRDFDDPETFFGELRHIIEALHARELAHGDLKKRENVMIDAAGRPYVIDFGVATVRLRGFHPINHFVHNTLRRYDINALHKHLYRAGEGRLVPADESIRFGQTLIERWSRAIRPYYAKLRQLLR